MDILIRRYGRMIDLSPDGRAPLDSHVVDMLRPELVYQKRIHLRAHQRYSPDGFRRGNVEIEHRQMYTLEEGRLVTSYGFYSRILGLLQAAGHQLHYLDMTPPPTRPECFVQDWNRVHQHVNFRHEVQLYCLQQMASHEQGIIVAPPAFGKTELIVAMCHLFPYAKIHIAVRPIDVAKRIWRQLSRTIPNVGIVGGGGNAMGDRVTVFVSGSLHKSDGDADIFIGDEGHQLVAENSSNEIGRHYRFSRMFFLTATPTGRGDGTDVRLEMLGGPPIFHLTYPEGVACGLIVPLRVRWLPVRMLANPAADKVETARERWGIWRNEVRHALVAADARANYNPDVQVLMLCAKVEHAIYQWRHLPEFSLCYGEQEPEKIAQYQRNNILPPGFVPIDGNRREELRAAFEAGTLKKVIATDVWATGVDFPGLQVCYRLDARASEIIDKQAPARASRIYNGKEYGEVVDCCDVFDDGFYRNSLARRRHYRECGWEQTDWPQTRGRGAPL